MYDYNDIDDIVRDNDDRDSVTCIMNEDNSLQQMGEELPVFRFHFHFFYLPSKHLFNTFKINNLCLLFFFRLNNFVNSPNRIAF